MNFAKANNYQPLFIYLVLTLAIFAVFSQVRNFDFIYFDDQHYVTENEHVQAGLTRESTIWAFTTGHSSNWHPLTWLSHMLDCQLFGLNPTWHHLVNLLLHTINTLLIFTVFRKMTGALWQSAFIAAAFALHPLHIESVVWISERKDMLSTLFWMLTTIAYLRYVKTPRLKSYLLVLLLFALGLMAKPMLVTLPFVLLLLDYWPLQRLQLNWQSMRSLIWEKLPLFILAAVSSTITFFVQQAGGAVAKVEMIPVGLRVTNAVTSYMKYIAKMFYPAKLAVLYPYSGQLPLGQVIISALLLLAISILIIRLTSKYKYLLTGWLWYLGTLVPVIGLVQVGRQALADRYTYIPFIGLFTIIAFSVPDLLKKLRFRKIAISIFAIAVLLVLSAYTHLQLRYWKNTVTLFERAIEVTDDNYVAHYSLALDLQEREMFDQAIAHYLQALRINADCVQAHYNLATIRVKQKKLSEAMAHLSEVLRIQPDHFEAHGYMGRAYLQQDKPDLAALYFKKALQIEPDNLEMHKYLGKALLKQGKLQDAVVHCSKALQIDPPDPDVYNDLGIIFGRQGKFDQAVTHLNKALQIEPNQADTHSNLGYVMIWQGKFDQAAMHLQKAINLDPNSANAHKNLADLLIKQGKADKAIIHFKESLRLKPDWLEPMNDLAWLLATHKDTKIRDPQQAITLAQRSCELTHHKNPNLLDTLAVAYASANRFPEAIDTAEKALRLAQSAQLPQQQIEQFQNRLRLFKQNKPYVEP